VSQMAYPESIPDIRGKKDALEFQRRLKHFRLTPEQKKLYAGAMALAKRLVEKG
jgi:hypothetical protein